MVPGTGHWSFEKPITDPWDERYIYLHLAPNFMVDVGKNISPMDPYGL